jgi:hypothetical protein
MVVVWFVDHTPMLLCGCDGSVDHIDASSMVVAVHLNHNEALVLVVMVILITHCPWL